jgi:CRP/FNR family cyclic AMP-dependent transcriptional regulator
VSRHTPSELFTSAEREVLNDLGVPIRFPPGSLIVKEGEDTDFVILLCEGHVAIRKGPRQLIVGIGGPGEVVGEIASVSRKPRAAGIHSIGEVEAQLIQGGDWLAFLHDHPRAMLAQLCHAQRRRAEATQVGAETLFTNEQKLVKAMVKLADSGLGVNESEGGVTFWNMNPTSLAEMANVPRGSAVQVLRRLKAANLVTTGRQRLIILDLAALRRLADDQAAEY